MRLEDYRTMTPRGLRLEARAMRDRAQSLMSNARALEELANRREDEDGDR